MDQRTQPRRLSALSTVALVLAAVGVGGCSSQRESTVQPTEIQVTTSTTTTAPQGRTQIVSYQSATVYAGATDFYFKDIDGQIVEFRVSNLPDPETIDLPDNMLDDAVVEGPPEANPDLVGEEFLLIYDQDDHLIRVVLNS